MSTSIIIDLVIVAVLAISIFLGWTKGLVRSLLTLVGMILALFIASQVGDYAADLIIEQVISPAAHTAVEQYIAELDTESLPTNTFELVEQALSTIENDLVREKALELLSSRNWPSIDLAETAQETVLKVSGELLDTVLYGVAQEILAAIICVLCFVVLSLLLKPIIWIVEKAFELPILYQMNHIGGMISGAVKGILLVLVAVWVLRLTGLYITDEVISTSYLLKIAVRCLDTVGLGTAVM